ncbi:MAG: helix-turn-helix transcriptional regulator [Fusobacteriaceae bacterium]|nr:helix-turn-helix transcriptional regulator [Fusobacteriaceae bacterium]
MFELKRTEEIIKEIMKEKKITQDELADKSGLTRPYVTGILSGGRKMSQKTIEKICSALEVNKDTRELIAFYELYNQAPASVQMKFFDNFSNFDKMEAKLRGYEKLDKFITLFVNMLQDEDIKNILKIK